MDTITIPRADYVQRHEGDHAFYAARTVGVAADLWTALDPEHRGTLVVGQRITFTHLVAGKVAFDVTDPDEEMDDLYPAGDLPFQVAASPFAPGDVIVHNITGVTHQVTRIDPNGDVLGKRLPGGGEVNIPADYVDEYFIARDAAAPTGTPAAEPRTFVVTVPAGLSDDDRANFMRHLYSPGAKRRGITVREAR